MTTASTDAPTLRTRERIVAAAIELFNAEGVANVRSRDLSDHLGISNGNLTYHFPTIATLVEEVIGHMVRDATTPRVREAPVTLTVYAESLRNVVRLQRKYPFFYTDAVELARRYPTVRELYRTLVASRTHQTRELLDTLSRDDRFRAEQDTRDALVTVIVNTLITWTTLDQLAGQEPEHTGDPVRIVLDLLLPHLTPKGRQEYESIVG